jgi:hypothetical protein
VWKGVAFEYFFKCSFPGSSRIPKPIGRSPHRELAKCASEGGCANTVAASKKPEIKEFDFACERKLQGKSQ